MSVFPVINNIKDVLHAVDTQYFLVADRGDHTIINYIYSSPETFPDIDGTNDEVNLLRREFRGLIFDKETGNIIRRPFHKFFNLGEKFETNITTLDVSQEHIILDKLDGSMIVPYMTKSGMIWGTKMGKTDFSYDVEDWVKRHHHVYDFSLHLINNGFSPIFEWMSPKNRIVIDYGSTEKLTLTAIRNMVTGEYVPYSEMLKMSPTMVVGVASKDSLSQKLVDDIRTLEDIEGIVIRFNSGNMVKVKADLYCQLHRVKSDIQYERGVVNLILEGKIDDLKPLMTLPDLANLEAFESDFLLTFNTIVKDIETNCIDIHNRNLSRKEIALEIVSKLPKIYGSIIFKTLDLGLSKEVIANTLKDIVLSSTTRNIKWDEFRKNSPFCVVKKWNSVVIDG